MGPSLETLYFPRRAQEGTHLGDTAESGVTADMLQALRAQWLLFLGSLLPISKEQGWST